jgi:hypothetical protein
LTWSGREEKGDTKKWLDGCLDEPQQGQQSSLTILDMAPRKLVLALVVAAAIGSSSRGHRLAGWVSIETHFTKG